MKKILTSIIFWFFIQLSFLPITNAQTNVSGGIYANTTWTAANSPYIVTDTVVVFPGVVLTIDPGVEVRFANNTMLEIREATLIAIGSVSDSIIFTSNDPAPTPGNWIGIRFNPNSTLYSIFFNFCNFHFAQNAIYVDDNMKIYIDNSTFSNNLSGIGNDNGYFISLKSVDSCYFHHNVCGIGSYVNNAAGTRLVSGDITWCSFKENSNTGAITQGTNLRNCIFESNQVGLYSQGGNTTAFSCFFNSNTVAGIQSTIGDSIRQCEIKNNAIGIIDFSYGQVASYSLNVIENNYVGIRIEPCGQPILTRIYCNKICNITYDIVNNSTWNFDASNNFWCLNDSASISALILDGYDNINSGLITITPIDTLGCYLSAWTDVSEIKDGDFLLYPNPVEDVLWIKMSDKLDGKNVRISIYDYSGKVLTKIKNENINHSQLSFDVSSYAKGVYFVVIESDDFISKESFTKQ